MELAAEGACDTIAEIRRRLESEGYAVDALDDRAVVRRLRDLIATADRTARPFRPK